MQIIEINYKNYEYPKKLREISKAPKSFYYCGTLNCLDGPTVAIVGARDCSNYGKKMAHYFGYNLARAGVTIISGMALGIDYYAHKAAIEAGGQTIAVLGCGIDICYPKQNQALYKNIPLHGALISEFSLKSPPVSYHFPIRNRIISGLCDVLLIIEAKDKSGSLITANHALEQGKSIYALPGQIDNPLSIGCHKLIYDGAQIAYDYDIILQELGMYKEKILKSKPIEKQKIDLPENSKKIYSLISDQPTSLDYLLSMSNISYGELSMVLMDLELDGYIKKISSQYFITSK